MSTQMEFIMQLYMMSLLQQQQQHQQQQQQQQQQYQTHSQLPQYVKKEEDISSSTTTLPGLQFMLQQQQQQQQQLQHQLLESQAQQTQQYPQQNKQRISRMQKSSNSHQSINCSRSSRSCSPNSNLNPLTPNPPPQYTTFDSNSINNTNSFLPQMLLNTLPPLTQLMLQQQQQQQYTNLLLTPTTPNSHNQQQQQLLAMATDFVGNMTMATNLPSATSFQLTPNSQICSTNNFLQSSTVTSTPTEKSLQHVDDNEADVDEAAESETKYVYQQHVGNVKNVAADNSAVGDDVIAHEDNKSEYEAIDKKVDDDNRDRDDDDNEDNDDDEEDYKPLSSLHSSSGTTTTTNASSEKLLLMSGVQALESTTDSYDSPSMYTPIKQPADSSFSTVENLSLCKLNGGTKTTKTSNTATTSMDHQEDSNITPLPLANSILTPPSSDQAKSKQTSSNSLTANNQQTISLTTASSLDAFLQNEDNLKNLKKVSSYLECENVLCRQETLREHFHCSDEPCQGKILSKKDDIIRHLKWHKKRKESLLLGFARFSSSDDCAPAYGAGCNYNWKQTHYHCIYEHCSKVYVSTSDVQMHANFHRKDSEIVQEGFRRFRAHENCPIEDCPFFGKKISHYHCCRGGCNHTFKNKADMDKHKTYHLKDYQLTQDGFKKILKTEVCPFESCKFSTVCNHIHCVRENCNYILHSSSQMISHKRKHDRQDGEQNYQQFKTHEPPYEEESPKPAELSSVNTSTPLSSHSAEAFLARKRGRPPKKIQLPADTSNDMKRIKLESNANDSNSSTQGSLNTNAMFLSSNGLPFSQANALANMFPHFLPNFNPAAAVAAQNATDPNAPNFQLTHLMAMFQLQNPLFYQNLYPNAGSAANSGLTVANVANMLAAGTMPQNAAMLGNLAAFSAASAAAAAQIKSEFSNKQEFKE